MKISVIGLGKLGSCYAAFCASRGYSVVGFDIDSKKVEAINLGLPPVEEPNLAALVRQNKKQLRATTDIADAIINSEATFLIVPTPSKKDGSFSLEYILKACEGIGEALKSKKSYHLICIVSTVLPGDSRGHIIPALEVASGKKFGRDFGFAYNPSLIAIGDVIYNLQHPDFLFLGAHDSKSRDVLAAIYKKLYPGLAPERMSIESAELAKIALNSFVTMKISFANILGEISEQIPGSDVDQVTRAIGKDKRIGSRYLSSGLGFGGPCFPRDNFAFAFMAKKRGIPAPLAVATHAINRSIPEKITAILTQSAGGKKKTIGFLGVSYKPRTTMTEESQALEIAGYMHKKGYSIVIYEPLGKSEAERTLGHRARYAKSLKELVEKSDILFVSNRDKSFTSLPSLIKKGSKKKIVVDPWGMFEQKSFGTKAHYKAVGRNTDLK